MNSLFFYDTRIGKVAIADNGRAVILLKFFRDGRTACDRADESRTAYDRVDENGTSCGRTDESWTSCNGADESQTSCDRTYEGWTACDRADENGTACDRTDENGTGTAVGCMAEDAEMLLRRTFGNLRVLAGGSPFAISETPLIREAARQLYEYLDGKRKVFCVPLELEGTPFQKKVWQALTEIPYGQTRTYREIAERIGNPKAARAVGMANNRNPAAVFVPCHRVIGADGSLVGYAGGLDIKKKLLDLERMHTPDKMTGGNEVSI